MASPQAVKKYLAYWFQVGKKLIISNQNKVILPRQIVCRDRFSEEFEECWNLVSNPQTGDCYLEGTNYTIQELLSPKWEITNCARCDMPVPMIEVGVQDSSCVCNDIENWPNNELPSPREPINNQQQLNRIRQSLTEKSKSSINKNYKTEDNESSKKKQNNYLHQLAIKQIQNSQIQNTNLTRQSSN